MNNGETISPGMRVMANKRSAACDLEGEMVILNLDSGVYCGLNSVGAAIWNYIQSERTVEEVVEYLLGEYKVDRARCEAEVAALLERMTGEGLIQMRASAAFA